MPARLPLQAKSPFRIDPRPLREMASARVGLLCASRALRSLQLPGQVQANLRLKSRRRGLEESQWIEALLLLQIAGGDCPEDIVLLHQDACLERGLGFALPKARTVRDFLERFHDEELARSRPARTEQKSFILPASDGVQQLQAVQAGWWAKWPASIRRRAKR